MVDLHRAAGTLLGLAAGDALGAGYEFQSPPFDRIEMRGGGLGPFAPGEWTDDTSMAICIAEVTATGSCDLETIGARFLDWYRSGPPDVGNLTRAVLGEVLDAHELPARAAAVHTAHPDGTAGNGALMRTAPVALATLEDPDRLATLARDVAGLTHADPLAGDSCVLWSIAIERAVATGRFDRLRDGLARVPEERRTRWEQAITAAEQGPPGRFRGNGFTVAALQAAYAAIRSTPVPEVLPARHLQHALEAAVAIGDDTDTVAAIAGALLGAAWGASAVPFRWRRMLHGWPGRRASDLVRLAVRTVWQGGDDAQGWPGAAVLAPDPTPAFVRPCPGDEGLLLGNRAALPEVVGEVDAVVSLSRVGSAEVPAGLEHHEVWLVDRRDPQANPNLGFVVADAVEAVRTLREEDKRVLLHGAAGRSRLPAIAAAVLADREGRSGRWALESIGRVLPAHDGHHDTLLEAVRRAYPER
jgi:ADP-ribosyl-[dinitrogen reductase] hydrolase